MAVRASVKMVTGARPRNFMDSLLVRDGSRNFREAAIMKRFFEVLKSGFYKANAVPIPENSGFFIYYRIFPGKTPRGFAKKSPLGRKARPILEGITRDAG